MELVEPIDHINDLLEKQFGKHDDQRPRYRVVLAAEQTEKRWMTHTDEGLKLLYPEVREVIKYQHIKPDRYVLEQLSIVPGGVETDLIEKLSYEPLWTFEDRHGDYLPPRFDMCKYIIDAIFDRLNNRTPRHIIKDDPEREAKELARVEEFLFGDETKVTDALGLGLGVTDFNPKVDFNTEKTEEVKPS